MNRPRLIIAGVERNSSIARGTKMGWVGGLCIFPLFCLRRERWGGSWVGFEKGVGVRELKGSPGFTALDSAYSYMAVHELTD